MKICAYNYLVPNVKPLRFKKDNNCSFTAHYDIYDNLMQVDRGGFYKCETIKNYTNLFRDIKVFKELPQYLVENYPQGVKIYDYACSIGHEASSIIIGLHDALPEKLAEKYLPILAFDKNPKIVKMAQKHKLKLQKEEVESFKWFEKSNINEYFSPLRKSRDNQKNYRMSDKLTNNVVFSEGDIFEDLRNGKLSAEPCVLFFRNATQFMSKKGVDELLGLMSNKLVSKSTVIIGEMDRFEFGAMSSKKLCDSGFKPVKNNLKPEFNDKSKNSRYEYLDLPFNLYCFIKR